MSIRFIFFVTTLIICLTNIAGLIPVLAQSSVSNSSLVSSSNPIIDITSLNNQQIKDQINSLQAQQNLNSESIKSLQVSLKEVTDQNQALGSQILSLTLQEGQDETVTIRIKTAKDNLILGQKAEADIQNQIKTLATQSQELNTNQKNLQFIIDQNQKQQDQSGSVLRQDVISSSWKYIFFGILVIIYFIFQNILIKVITSNILDNRSRTLITWIVRVFFVLAILVTSLSFFASELNGVLAFTGLISAALAFALQDFVASFFAWIFIRTKGKFKEKDLIQVTTPTGYVIGKVVRIEVLRMILDGREGGDSTNLDREKPTGRQISIPNSLVVRGAVFNTSSSELLWHSTNFLITLNSNWAKAEIILRKILDNHFDIKFIEFHKLKIDAGPRLTIDIASSGVNLNIWFPAPIGEFRSTLDTITRQVLVEFKKSKIQLAFNTLTIESKTQ